MPDAAPRSATVAALHRFPVKGLSPEPIDDVTLTAGACFPGDRMFAVENGPSGFNEDAPAHLPKTKFLMLQRDERLARLRTVYDDARHRLTIRLDGALVCEADLDDAAGRATLERFLAGFMGAGRGAPKVLRGPGGFRFTDSKQGFVSLLNLASVAAVEAVVGRPVDPLRFRANVALRGLDAWVENDFIGRRLRLGTALVEVIALTDRCAATGVDPVTAVRDMNIVKTLASAFGHIVCGVYARVVEDGTVRAGDSVAVLPA
jgi:uncharacterized protein YcbX